MRKIRLAQTRRHDLWDRLSADLNPAQLAAATAPDGFNLILAGPGSGKTRVITYRVAHLIATGVPAESILLVTFTRRAAREMIARLETLVGSSAARVWAGTFHHIGNRLLRDYAEILGIRPNFSILDREDQLDLVKLAMHDAGLTSSSAFRPQPESLRDLLSAAFNLSLPLDQVVREIYPGLIEWLPRLEATATHYAARKRQANCLDFDDLLAEWVRLIQDFPEPRTAMARQFRHILVDELQDTNRPQIQIVERLARAGHGNLTAVGDDAQSIYRFRGADYDNILRFPERNPDARIFSLDLNYRSTPQIVAFAAAVIAANQTGFPKHLRATRPDGPRPALVAAADTFEEAEIVCQLVLDALDQGVELRRQAVLFRNHQDSALLQAELLARKIPYEVRSGLRFFEQAHIKDVLAYLRIHVNPRDEIAWRRLLLMIPGVGTTTAGALFAILSRAPDPLRAIEAETTMAAVPARSRGLFAAFVADLRKIRKTKPDSNPADAIHAILASGYANYLRGRYDRPDNRIEDLGQLALLASRYNSLERFIADVLLAGDVYAADRIDPDDPSDALVLSTIHQAKGLEWSRVYIIRLVEDSFPHARSLQEPGGLEEERRLLYVAASRAQDELTLLYPQLLDRRRRISIQLATPSRFLTELDPTLYDPVPIERAGDIAWTDGPPLP
ncbi:MAG: DNA helicase [Isosphaeraceae bacterium]|jgi:DNA helicase-2/ATP-dependent DNA helicase PcrA|nr:MAG: DNA helicase [Isosphaeraceae bacterium]